MEKNFEFKFEPNPHAVLDVLIPQLVKCRFTRRFWNPTPRSTAPHAGDAQRLDAAEDIIKELNYTYNKARQSAITKKSRRSWRRRGVRIKY